MNQFYTAESVTEGHPDKIADQISDAVLDAILAEDPHGRVACETVVATGQIHVVGEILRAAMLIFLKSRAKPLLILVMTALNMALTAIPAAF